jgi:hypothetical protein
MAWQGRRQKKTHQPLRGGINILLIYYCTMNLIEKDLINGTHLEGLGLFLFGLSPKRNKKKYPLRSLCLCGEFKISFRASGIAGGEHLDSMKGYQ